MDVQKYIDKMVLVPIERWNQLLDIEQKTFEKTEEQSDSTPNSQDSDNKTNTDVTENVDEEEHDNIEDYPPPPPPGIPMNVSDIEYVNNQKPKKKRKQTEKHTGNKTVLPKYRKKETHMNGWLSLP